MISMGYNEYQVFYNRAQAAPLVWCVTPNGTREWELATPKVSIYAPSETIYNAKTTDDEDDGLPSAWILAAGELSVDNDGCASIVKPGWGNMGNRDGA